MQPFHPISGILDMFMGKKDVVAYPVKILGKSSLPERMEASLGSAKDKQKM